MAIRNTSCAGRRNKDRREASGDAEVYPERKFKGTRYDAGRENLERESRARRLNPIRKRHTPQSEWTEKDSPIAQLVRALH